MKFARYLTFILTFLLSNANAFENIRVSIFNQFDVKTVAISPIEGKYQFSSEKGIIYKLKKNNIIYFTAVGDSISVWDLDKHLGIFKQINFMGLTRQSVFKIESAYPALPTRYYEEDIEITCTNHKLSIVNYVSINNYLAGVVEAESGPNAELEFYKSQAVISRTYLYDRITREGEDKYFIGDDVNYQVYKGKCMLNPAIRTAVVHTEGLVIVDSNQHLITATFHSNSGGQTANSEDVWQSATSYLKTTPDPFSIDKKNTIWRDTITTIEWEKYLNKQGIQLTDQHKHAAFNYKQEQRQKYYTIANKTVPLRQIRKDFRLRSTWFSFYQERGNIVIVGRGYGHGVGLSQEGAMEMAIQQFSFSDIIHFYYQNIKVVPYQEVTQN